MRNLAGATLDNLRCAVLAGCDASGANLERCDLTGARLRGAIGLSGLRFAGAHDFPAVRVDALQPGDVVVHEGALRVVRVWEGYFGNREYGYVNFEEYGYVNFEEGKRWGEGHITATLPCCQR